MSIIYSSAAAAFFDVSMRAAYEAAGTWPSDAVQVSPDAHAALIAAQATGKRIVSDETGNPIAVDPPPPSADQLMALLRAERDRRLAESDKAVLPDRWESYTAEQKAAWSTYRQVLRELPETTADPTNPTWPATPSPTT